MWAAPGLNHDMHKSHLRLPILAVIAVLLTLQAGSASAQSLRCSGQMSGVGDSKSSVVQKCGEPMAVEAVCVQQTQMQPPMQSMYMTAPDGSLRQMFVPQAPQCVPMEDWIFHRGPGNFLAIVRFQNGVVESVRDGARAP